MRLRPLISRLTILVAIPFCSTSFASSAGFIKGTVSDSGGSAIKEAHVIFHADPAGRGRQKTVPDQSQDTDAMGQFNMELQPGFYDVCVMATAFAPVCKKVLVIDSKTSVHNVSLGPDPLVSEHLADTF